MKDTLQFQPQTTSVLQTEVAIFSGLPSIELHVQFNSLNLNPSKDDLRIYAIEEKKEMSEFFLRQIDYDSLEIRIV